MKEGLGQESGHGNHGGRVRGGSPGGLGDCRAEAWGRHREG